MTIFSFETKVTDSACEVLGRLLRKYDPRGLRSALDIARGAALGTLGEVQATLTDPLVLFTAHVQFSR